ncbi:Hsp70 family protein [Arthrobacter sp. AD-310]
MSYVLAVDVGTSFTAAAVVRFSPGATPVPESLPLGLRASAVPSVVFYPEEGPVLVGEAAERRGLDSPGRLIREFKRRIGDSVPFSVGTLALPPEDVYATMARWVADRAAEREGEPPSDIILTHPAAWGGHRTSLVRDALAAKGLANVTLLTEPEAAALHYASQVRVEDGSIVAVYDLGGGTFDTAVLRKAGSNRFEPLGRPEGIENLGGADFDAAVFRYVADNTDGALAGLDTTDPGVLAALARLRRECVEAKEALSADSEASISVLLPGVQQQVRLVRSEFEALIEEPVRDTVDALEQSLAEMDLEPADLTAVLLIGGSSRIPLVAQLISAELDRPIAVDADPKSSICLGAAVSAVLAQADAAQPSTAAGGMDDDGAAVGPDSSVEAAGDVHAPVRLASWSRKNTTAAGAAGAHGPGHPHHGGAHAPKPTVRLTAIAAAAALFTGLTATAAQSPEGFGNLTAIFVPEAGAAPDGKSGGSASGSGGAGGTAAGVPGQSQAPLAGIEAGVDRAASNKRAGLDVEASPTSRPSASAAAKNNPSGSTSTGSSAGADAGTEAGAPGTSTGTADSTAGGSTDPGATPTGTLDPTTQPPAPDPTTEPPAPEPTTEPPAPDPTTEPPAPEPTTEPPAPEPTTEPPAPEPTTEPPAPEPTSEPTTQPPAPEPTPEPPAPEPVTETSVPSEPVV